MTAEVKTKGRSGKPDWCISQPTLNDILSHHSRYRTILHNGRPFPFAGVSAKDPEKQFELYHGTGRKSEVEIEFIGLRGKLAGLFIFERHGRKSGVSPNLVSSDIVYGKNNKPEHPSNDQKALVTAFKWLLASTNIRHIPSLDLYDKIVEHASIYFFQLLSPLIRDESKKPDKKKIETLLVTEQFVSVEA